MTICKLAGIPVAFHHRSPSFARLMREYLSDEAPALSVSVSEEEVAAEMAATAGLGRMREEERYAYHEALALYRRFAEALPAYGGFFLHAALLSVDGVGIAVTARSGVGKSTHASLWRTLLGDRCRIINGDKPLVRRGEDGTFFGYGTPFAGKEGWQENAAAPIRHLVLLERAEADRVTPITEDEAFPLFYPALLLPKDEEALSRLLPLAGEFLRSVRVFRAGVTKELSAAEAAYKTILKGELL